jgi:hypothetical protein
LILTQAATPARDQQQERPRETGARHAAARGMRMTFTAKLLAAASLAAAATIATAASAGSVATRCGADGCQAIHCNHTGDRCRRIDAAYYGDDDRYGYDGYRTRHEVCDSDGDRCYATYDRYWNYREYYRRHGYRWNNGYGAYHGGAYYGTSPYDGYDRYDRYNDDRYRYDYNRDDRSYHYEYDNGGYPYYRY